MGRTSADIIDYCNECLDLFPKSTVAHNTVIIIHLENLLPQLCKIVTKILLHIENHLQSSFPSRRWISTRSEINR